MDCKKHLFSLPDNQHYLNGAYFSPMLQSVEQAGIAGIRQKRAPWKVQPDDFFRDIKKLRTLFAGLIHAEKARQIAILPSTSYGTATIANNLPDEAAGKNIMVLGEQYPSNVYVWKRYCKRAGADIKTVEAPAEFQNRGKKWNERILDAIDDDTLMVSMGHIHWTDGTLFDLQAIGERTREVGAYLVVDGTQSVGALPFDVQNIKPDALICAGYKWLMGPYSIALGYFGERFSDGIPLEEGWIERKGSDDFSELINYTDHYRPGAVRYDVGECSNFILVPMMIKALEQVLAWGPAEVQQYCRQLIEPLVRDLPDWGYDMEDPEWRAQHLFGIYLPESIQTAELKRKLTAQNIYVSVRGKALRVAPNVYNDDQDVAALCEVLSNQ